jgi:hypothetical protein
MFRKDRKKVEEHTKHNEEEILASSACGCLGCLTTLTPDAITEWAEEADADHPEKRVDRTAICPHCGDALIIGDHSGYQISDTFLETMRMR